MRIFKMALLVVFAAATTLGTASSAPPSDKSTVTSNSSYWPLPVQGSGQTYWWSYRWSRGKVYPDKCRNSSGQRVGISATYFNDTAFGDNADNPNDLLSLNFFKDDECAYWEIGTDRILRWYAEDYVRSNTAIKDVNGTNRGDVPFLSFRGHSEWIPDRSGYTVFRDANGNEAYSINGKYAQQVNGEFTFGGGFKYKYQNGDHTKFPNYAVLPKSPLSANILVSTVTNEPGNSTNINDIARFYRYIPAPTPEDGWDKLRAGSESVKEVYDFQWAMYMRETSMTYQGSRVFYVGFSEVPLAKPPENPLSQPGACEDWWFAEGIGPIYIMKYSNGVDSTKGTLRGSTFAECKQNLAVFNGSALNDPNATFRYNPNVAGMLTINNRCTEAGCRVDY